MAWILSVSLGQFEPKSVANKVSLHGDHPLGIRLCLGSEWGKWPFSAGLTPKLVEPSWVNLSLRNPPLAT
jgi:hypothetical protein